jgi:hypothetical protein
MTLLEGVKMCDERYEGAGVSSRLQSPDPKLENRSERWGVRSISLMDFLSHKGKVRKSQKSGKLL